MSVEARSSPEQSPQDRPPQGRFAEDRPPEKGGQRLDSWKAIAEYLKRDVRSVQRWERSLGLPVHRVSGEKGGVVFAFTAELDRWFKNRPSNAGSGSETPTPFSDDASAEAPAENARLATRAQADSVESTAKPHSNWLTYASVIFAIAVLVPSATYVIGRASSRRALVPSQNASPRIMLAVLPFMNLSGDVTQDYFADGLTEEMITDLGCQNPQALGVIARTSAMKYKNTNKDIAQIGRELGVNYVLEGSVRREGNKARISAQLIQVSDQTHLWAQTYELQIKDMLSVQRDVAATIAGKIKINLKNSEPRELAQIQLANPDAYDEYLHGRYLLSQRSLTGFRDAIKFFNQAIEKDPSFALAYAGLADSHILLAFATGGSSASAKAAALKALALDDNLAEAHTSLAAVYIFDWNWSGAEKEFQRALALNPNYALAHHWYGNLYLSPMGRHQEAIAELKQALELDPLSLIVSTDLGYAYFFAGDNDQAYAQYQKVLASDSSFVSVHWVLIPYYEQKGMYDFWAQELAQLCSLDGDPDLAQQIKSEYAEGGREKLLQFIVASQRKGLYFDPLLAASAELSLGNKEDAIEDLEKAYRRHYFNLLRMKADPTWTSLRSDPRFEDLERRIGLM
jgi:TolB-like protein